MLETGAALLYRAIVLALTNYNALSVAHYATQKAGKLLLGQWSSRPPPGGRAALTLPQSTSLVSLGSPDTGKQVVDIETGLL